MVVRQLLKTACAIAAASLAAGSALAQNYPAKPVRVVAVPVVPVVPVVLAVDARCGCWPMASPRAAHR